MADRDPASPHSLVSTDSLVRFCGRRGDGVLLWDRSYTLLGANERAAHLLRLPRASLAAGATMIAVSDAVSKGPIGPQGADLFPTDLAAIDWGGWDDLPSEIKFDAAGVSAAFSAVGSDLVVTQLQPAGTINSAVEALARQNLYLETTLENLTDGVMMIDENDCIITCNRRFREFMCVDHDHYFQGMSLFDFGMLHGDLRDLSHEERAQGARERANWASANHGAAVRRSRTRSNANGQVVEIALTRLAQGGAVITARDATHEHQLNRQRVLLETVINNIEDGVSLMSKAGRYEVFNERFPELFGVDPAQIEIGTHILDMFRMSADYAMLPHDEAEAEMQRRTKMALSQTEEFLDYDRELLSGRTIHLRRVLLDDDAIVTMYRDVTKEKERERLLDEARHDAEEANRLKTDFIARVSHELRTPMHGVLGMAELIRQSPLSDNQTRCLDVLCRSGRHMVDLIDGLLTISTLETGEMVLEPEETDLAHLLSDCVDMIRPRAQEKGIVLSLDHDFSAGGTANVDGLRLAQVMINLITNAVKYTDTGRVDVSAHTLRDGADLVLHSDIMDTGCGIAPDQLVSIFDKFKQLRGSEDAMVEGVGLGLSIAQSIVDLMSGELTATSILGQGSTFSIEIRAPAVMGAAAPPISQAAVFGGQR